MKHVIFICILLSGMVLTGCNHGTTNAVIEHVTVITDNLLGAVQGVVMRDGFIYAYGDYKNSNKHVGVIREYTSDLNYTGRMVELTKNGQSIIPHPTGLTWNQEWGTFIGNTVKRKGEILRIDWKQAWIDRNLNNALLDIIEDDAASNGSRPVFVKVGDEFFIASADYFGFKPELRLYNISAMMKHKKTSSEGVIKYRIRCSQNTQNLYWDSDKGYLTLVQNRWPFLWPYRGFHLETIILSDAIAAGSALNPSVIVSSIYFNDKEELEGWWPAGNALSIFAVNRKTGNLFTAEIRMLQEKEKK